MKISKVIIYLLLVMALSATAIAQEWKVPIIFRSGGTEIELEFGAKISATRGFDKGIDMPAPPPGPRQTKNAYFDISEYEEEEFLQKLLKDYRPLINESNRKEIWKLHVVSDEEIELKWNTSSVPENIYLYMDINGDGIEDVNMKEKSNYSLPNGTFEIHIVAKYGNETRNVSKGIKINISLHKGWNMVSIPLGNATISVLDCVLSYAYWYDPKTKSYKIVFIEDMELGKGYWVYAEKDCNITVWGIPLFNYSIKLKEGWNMIGAPAYTIDFSNLQTDPPNSVLQYAFWYNATTKSYEISQKLEPTKGYWVYAIQNCTLYVKSY